VSVPEPDCGGAPRDLGFDQGRSVRDELQRAFAALPLWRRAALRLGRGSPRFDRAARDLLRHFPQQSECLEGMARGAGVPYRWLVERTAASYAPADPHGVADAPGVALEPPLAPVPRLLRGVPRPALVRRSQPDGGWNSVELTLPWLGAGLAGVNAGGLAVVGVTFAAAAPGDPCAAPAGLLVQDCLARFDSVAGARDWCIGRPAGGRGALLLADAGGAVAAVEIDGGERRAVAAKDGLLLEGAAAPDAAGRLRTAAPGDAAAAAAALGGRVVVIDPAERRLGLFGAGGEAAWWRPRPPEAGQA
jgi:hypothetical protein